MINKKITILKIFILSVIFIGLNIITSNAAYHSTDPKGEAGSNVSITITSTEALEDFNIDVTNNGGLEFVSVSTKGIVNGTKVGYMSLTEKLTILATYTFKTPSTPGTYKVSFNVNGVTNSSVVTVTAPASSNNSNTGATETPSTTPNNEQPTETKKSNNANLANLGITPNDFRGFKSGTTAYNVTVPNDVEQVNVYAKLQDSKAKITAGTGNQELKVGKNELKVVVTAEDGTTTKTYTINVTREEAKATNETENNNTTDANQTTENEEKKEEKKKSDLIKLEIEGYTISPKFSPDVYEYKLDLKDNVDKLNVITEGANHNVNIEVAGNTELKDGENTITILVTNEETKETSTYQIMVNKQVTTNNETDESINRAIKKANKIRAIILGIIGFIIVAIIVFFIVRKNMYEEDFDEDDYDYDSEDKEKIDLNEEDELFKRVNKEIFEKKVKDDYLEIKDNYKMEIEDSNIEDIDKRARRYKEEEGTKREEEKQRIQEDEEEKREFFRTSKSKPKGKHF